jgi:hypothetical protein
MSDFVSKLEIHNERKQPRVVVVEPWADAYTLLPDSRLLIVARCEHGVPWFSVSETDDTTVLSCEGADQFYVEHEGKREHYQFA